jgi:hypothetical protein
VTMTKDFELPAIKVNSDQDHCKQA